VPSRPTSKLQGGSYLVTRGELRVGPKSSLWVWHLPPLLGQGGSPTGIHGEAIQEDVICEDKGLVHTGDWANRDGWR
jgi:hypothetical protein